VSSLTFGTIPILNCISFKNQTGSTERFTHLDKLNSVMSVWF
jgi:hypothetical protein